MHYLDFSDVRTWLLIKPKGLCRAGPNSARSSSLSAYSPSVPHWPPFGSMYSAEPQKKESFPSAVSMILVQDHLGAKDLEGPSGKPWSSTPKTHTRKQHGGYCQSQPGPCGPRPQDLSPCVLRQLIGDGCHDNTFVPGPSFISRVLWGHRGPLESRCAWLTVVFQ